MLTIRGSLTRITMDKGPLFIAYAYAVVFARVKYTSRSVVPLNEPPIASSTYKPFRKA